uniref:Uncharacterized protein n=1 Tax=Cajanus cajan TaxID=3821 RepID=A0A151QNB2_CAJCA|nr:hypothetical protein KK1_047706 [Cajanus cajan]
MKGDGPEMVENTWGTRSGLRILALVSEANRPGVVENTWGTRNGLRILALVSESNGLGVVKNTWRTRSGLKILVLANFVVNDQKHKEYIFWSLGKKWKDKRCRLFDKFHDWEKSVEQNIQNHPPHIPQDHWAIFVRYRRSSKAIDMSNKNTTNRAKLMIPHILGSKTLARKRDELELLHGREFSRAEMYQVSHKKPDGNFVNEEARELHVSLMCYLNFIVI